MSCFCSNCTNLPLYVLCRRWHTLRWRHNGRDSVYNHQPHDCLLSCLFRRRSKKTSKLRVTGLYVGNSPGTGEFPVQMASNAEKVSIWWRHHDRLTSRKMANMLNITCYFTTICVLWISEHNDLNGPNTLYGDAICDQCYSNGLDKSCMWEKLFEPCVMSTINWFLSFWARQDYCQHQQLQIDIQNCFQWVSSWLLFTLSQLTKTLPCLKCK